MEASTLTLETPQGPYEINESAYSALAKNFTLPPRILSAFPISVEYTCQGTRKTRRLHAIIVPDTLVLARQAIVVPFQNPLDREVCSYWYTEEEFRSEPVVKGRLAADFAENSRISERTASRQARDAAEDAVGNNSGDGRTIPYSTPNDEGEAITLDPHLFPGTGMKYSFRERISDNRGFSKDSEEYKIVIYHSTSSPKTPTQTA